MLGVEYKRPLVLALLYHSVSKILNSKHENGSEFSNNSCKVSCKTNAYLLTNELWNPALWIYNCYIRQTARSKLHKCDAFVCWDVFTDTNSLGNNIKYVFFKPKSKWMTVVFVLHNCFLTVSGVNHTDGDLSLSSSQYAARSGVTRGLNQGGNLAERGAVVTAGDPLVNTQRKFEKCYWIMIWMSITKTEITGKHSDKRQKTATYWKPKEYSIPKYKQSGGRFHV